MDEILSEKNEQKVSAREEVGMELGRGDEDLRWRREFTAFQRCLGLDELECIREEKYFFLVEAISL